MATGTRTGPPPPPSGGEHRNDGERVPHDRGLLASLGERVQHLRLRAGMTRQALARHSGVSLRYLADVEAGRGNASIRVLERIASALHQPLQSLFETPDGLAAERALLVERLGRLDAEGLRAVEEFVRRELAPEPERAQRVALLGLRGAGKSTLGRMVATRIGCPWVDLAREIERLAGLSLAEIYALSGQAGYRRLERQALAEVVRSCPSALIETAGGIVSDSATYNMLLERCHTVWLRARPEEHMARVVGQGDLRPVAESRRAMEDLRSMLAARAPLYARAEQVLDTSGLGPEEAAARLETTVRALLEGEGAEGRERPAPGR